MDRLVAYLVDHIEKLAPLWVYPLAILAALAAHLEEARIEDPWRIRIMKWATRTGMAIFAVVMTFQLAAKILKLPDDWLIWVCGIGAHMGVEAIRFMKEAWRARLRSPGQEVKPDV